MTAIDSRTEQLLEKTIRKNPCIEIDGCKIYLATYQGHEYLRYIEDTRHITFTSWTEKAVTRSFRKFLSNVFTGRSPRMYILKIENPMTWDNEIAPLTDSHQQVVMDRVKRAILQKYSGCEINYDTSHRNN